MKGSMLNEVERLQMADAIEQQMGNVTPVVCDFSLGAWGFEFTACQLRLGYLAFAACDAAIPSIGRGVQESAN
jgi:hypothetical protein